MLAGGVEVSLRPRVPTSSLDEYEAGVTAAVQQGRGRHDVVLGVGGTAFAAVEVADRWGVPAVLRVGEAEPLPVVADWLAMPWSPPIELRARRAFALADTVVANSAAAVRTYRSQGWVANYVSFSDGVELADIDERVGRITRRHARSRLGIGTSELLVLTPGTLWPIKGQAALRAGQIHHRLLAGVATLHVAGHVHVGARRAGPHEQVFDVVAGVGERALPLAALALRGDGGPAGLRVGSGDLPAL